MNIQQLNQEQIQHNTSLLIEASKRGDIDKVQQLIPVSDPKSRNSLALITAAADGYTEIVKLLIPVCDPKSNNSLALFAALKEGHTEIIKLLVPVSDCAHIIAVIDDMTAIHNIIGTVNYDTLASTLHKYIDEHEAVQQQQRLQNELDVFLDNKNKSIKRKM